MKTEEELCYDMENLVESLHHLSDDELAARLEYSRAKIQQAHAYAITWAAWESKYSTEPKEIDHSISFQHLNKMENLARVSSEIVREQTKRKMRK